MVPILPVSPGSSVYHVSPQKTFVHTCTRVGVRLHRTTITTSNGSILESIEPTPVTKRGSHTVYVFFKFLGTTFFKGGTKGALVNVPSIPEASCLKVTRL